MKTNKWKRLWGWLCLPYYLLHPKILCFPTCVLFGFSIPITKQGKKEIFDDLQKRIHFVAYQLLIETNEKWKEEK